MDNMVKIRVTKEFMERMFTRDNEGNKLSIEWGEVDEGGFYVPTIVVNYNDNIVRKLQKIREAAIAYRKCHWTRKTRMELDKALREVIDG